MRFVAGDSIAQYRLVSSLGEGGMGQVYLAADTKLDRQVAIKVLSEELAGQAFALERFLREAKLASALSHPNITHIYEIGEAAGVPYLVMEFVSGEPLSRRIARGPITASETSAIGAQVADALEAAHAKNIVHRDIKPANIMIGVRGHVKVLDFGLAKLQSKPRASEETQFLTREGVVVGTVNTRCVRGARPSAVSRSRKPSAG